MAVPKIGQHNNQGQRFTFIPNYNQPQHLEKGNSGTKKRNRGYCRKKYITVPHPHHKNEILKLLNDLHILSNTVYKILLAAASLHSHSAMCNCCTGCSPSPSCGDSEHAATSKKKDERYTLNTCLMYLYMQFKVLY